MNKKQLRKMIMNELCQETLSHRSYLMIDLTTDDREYVVSVSSKPSEVSYVLAIKPKPVDADTIDIDMRLAQQYAESFVDSIVDYVLSGNATEFWEDVTYNEH